jgi:hypothetical protein
MSISGGVRCVGWLSLFVSLGLTFAGTASGYCLMTTCELQPPPAVCSGSRDERGCSIEGRTLHWKGGCLAFSVHRSGSARRHIVASDLQEVVSAAFHEWEAVDCGMGHGPALQALAYPQVHCDRVGFAPNGPNQNSWIFRDEYWPHAVEAEEAIALTTLTVQPSTGLILDADVELNSRDNAFTLEGGEGIDLASIVAHESGHVLGLGHSDWATSTMALGYEIGSVDARTLEADDERAICSAMPFVESSRVCDPEPIGGFDVGCEFDDGCCSIAPRRRSTASLLAVGLGSLLLVLRRRTPSARRQTRRRCCRPNPRDALWLP